MHQRKSQLYQSKILGIVKVNPKVVYISILLTIFFLRFNSKGTFCILNWNLGKKVDEMVLLLLHTLTNIKSMRTMISLKEKLS